MTTVIEQPVNNNRYFAALEHPVAIVVAQPPHRGITGGVEIAVMPCKATHAGQIRSHQRDPIRPPIHIGVGQPHNPVGAPFGDVERAIWPDSYQLRAIQPARIEPHRVPSSDLQPRTDAISGEMAGDRVMSGKCST